MLRRTFLKALTSLALLPFARKQKAATELSDLVSGQAVDGIWIDEDIKWTDAVAMLCDARNLNPLARVACVSD